MEDNEEIDIITMNEMNGSEFLNTASDNPMGKQHNRFPALSKHEIDDIASKQAKLTNKSTNLTKHEIDDSIASKQAMSSNKSTNKSTKFAVETFKSKICDLYLDGPENRQFRFEIC